MVNTKSIILGLALTLSATALPVEQQVANCKMNGTAAQGNAAIGTGAVGYGNTGAKTVTNTATSIAVSKTASTTLATVKPTTTAAATKASTTAIVKISTTTAAQPAATSSVAAPAAGLTQAQIVAIAPDSASCSGAPFPAECADASAAAPAIAESFTKYGFNTPGEQAALIAIMVYESGSFKYNKNHYPGRPGQGTRNMQMENFNKLYATAIKGPAAAQSADILSQLSDNESSFGSAAWFLKTQCSASIAQGLQSGSSQGWDAYLTQCVGTTHTADRDVAWTKAKSVLGA